jgi:hypothetical protein
MEAGLITEATNAVITIERVGIIGILVSICIVQFILRYKDKKTQEIMERQISAVERMVSVQEVHNKHIEKFMEEIVSKENLINERTIRIEAQIPKRRSA